DQFRTDAVIVRGGGEPSDEELSDEGPSHHHGTMPAGGGGLEVTGDGVVTSAIRPCGGETEVRVVALSATSTVATVRGAFTAARRVDVLGRDLDDADGVVPVAGGRLTVELGPWEIATIRLQP